VFKKIVFLFMAIALAAISAVGIGCTSQDGAPAIDLVPRQANLVADVNLHQIFSDADVLDLVSEIGANLEEPKTIDELLDQLEQRTGIDLGDFSRALVFSDTEFENYVGVILEGDFEQTALTDNIEGRLGEEMITTSYKGYELYLVTDEDEDLAISLLDDSSIALGATVAVKDVIDVKEGASSLGEPLRTTYDALGDVWIKAALEMPTEVMGAIGEVPIPGLETLQNIETIGLSFDKKEVNLSFQLKLLFPSISDAENARGALNALKGMLAFVPNLPDEVVEIVGSLNVSQNDSWVTVSFEATKSEIRAWAWALEPLLGDTLGIE